MTTGLDDDAGSMIFLSCDLTGSTKFKQRQDLVEPWQKVFLQFYREFPQRIATTQVALGTTDLNFELWKPIGDELIYSCVVRSEEHVYKAVRTWLKAMRDYELQSLDDTDMRTKGGAFIATFPGPDSRSSVPRFPDSEVSDAEVIELNRAALTAQDHGAYVYDYFGPSIDTGFRVIGKSDQRYFTLSVEVALAMLGRRITPGSGQGDTDARDIMLLDFVELKGVWEGERYPIVAIDTQYDNPIHQAYRKFESKGTPKELYDLCQACYQDKNWPSLYLPDGIIDFYHKKPDDALKDYIATSSVGAEQLAEDEPSDATDDLGEDLDLGLPTKGEVIEGFVPGDEQTHGYIPDGTVLCEASDPYMPPDSCNSGGDAIKDFNPTATGSCEACAEIWHDLPG